ncbi:MAG: protein-disulfide reductase DsbD domain-containing protein [Betaproteobacteria bacterium]
MPHLRIFPLAFFCALTLLSAWWPVAASPVKTPHVEAALISRDQSFVPGKPVELALRLKIIDHWHTYWQNPGDSGLPTKLTWSLPAGFSAGPIEWPFPSKLPLGPLMNFGYEGEVLHLVSMTTPAGIAPGKKIELKAKAEWLVCSDVCIPESADLAITLPATSTPPLPGKQWAAQFATAQAAIPVAVPDWKISTTVADGKLVIDLSPPATKVNPDIPDAAFYPLDEELIANAGKQDWSKTASGYRLSIPAADAINKSLTTVRGVVVASNGWGGSLATKAISISAPLLLTGASALTTLPATKSQGAAVSTDSLSLAAALLFAFAGGLLLNLMPCVFPVLGIKVMGFVRHAEADPGLLKKQGFSFLGGVLVSFWILTAVLMALRAAGESVGWGFQLQSPLFVTFLAILFLLMALNLSGVFEIGLRIQSAAGNLGGQSQRNALVDAFLSGVLATIVATPCTAPMMGAALGFTLSQPAHVSFLVFTAIALGVALPVLMLSLFPRWLRALPKPGAWMNTLKQFLAFPLFATVVWLAWVLGAQLGNDGAAKLLFGLVLIALAAWLYGHWQAEKPLRAVLAAIVIAACALTIAWPDAVSPGGVQSTSTENGWIPFSTEKIAELRAQKRPIFVDFTATWCITCQVNKRVALNQERVVKRFKELDVTRMKADWTVKDAKITEALAAFGRNGVPLYVFYPANGEPRILPEVLTADIVLSGIEPASAAVAAR